MSIQPILETARKFGFPVILTDSAGREPYVLVPLEKFESLVQKSRIGEPRLEAAGTVESSQPSQETFENISLEDRFYLEPLEEEPR